MSRIRSATTAAKRVIVTLPSEINARKSKPIMTSRRMVWLLTLRRTLRTINRPMTQSTAKSSKPFNEGTTTGKHALSEIIAIHFLIQQ
jgi:hypothetical protein